MFSNSLKHSPIAIAVFLLATTAQAAIVTFSGIDIGANGSPTPLSNAAAASFDAAAAAISSVNIITVESAALGSFTTLAVATGVSVSGLDYTNVSQQSVSNTTLCTVALCGGNTTSGGSKFLFINGGSMTFTFTTPQSYFGVYLAGLQLDGETLTFNDGSNQSIPIPNGGSGIQFIGFTDVGKTFTSVKIDTTSAANPLGDFVSVDDIRYHGSASAVPEPGTFALGALGLAALAGLKRRIRT